MVRISKQYASIIFYFFIPDAWGITKEKRKFCCYLKVFLFCFEERNSTCLHAPHGFFFSFLWWFIHVSWEKLFSFCTCNITYVMRILSTCLWYRYNLNDGIKKCQDWWWSIFILMPQLKRLKRLLVLCCRQGYSNEMLSDAELYQS